jgi:hypothetical protein
MEAERAEALPATADDAMNEKITNYSASAGSA